MRLRAPLACLALAVTCHAQPPLHIVVGVAPGGSSDTAARAVAERMSATQARAVVVENKPGASGRIALDALRAAPPGDTLLAVPIAVPVIAPLAFRDYDVSDVVPVARLATFDYAFVVSARREWRTFADFAAWARAPGNAAGYGTGGAGSLAHFVGAVVAEAAAYRAEVVPYASIAKLEGDLVGGHLASAVSATSDFSALHRAGRVRILATTGARRSLPDVPTFRELGYPGVEVYGWNAMFASARMPRRDIDAISAQVRAALDDPGVRDKLIAAGMTPAPTTPAELAAIVARERARWAPVIRASGFTADAP
jgi:tripartite-type tricarboxylate transporter receptor subunit TctC